MNNYDPNLDILAREFAETATGRNVRRTQRWSFGSLQSKHMCSTEAR